MPATCTLSVVAFTLLIALFTNLAQQNSVCSDLVRFCYPYMNFYGNWLEDQAWTGFACSIYCNDCYAISRTAFQTLVAGYTLSVARANVIALHKHIAGSNGEVLKLSDMPIYGDTNMRLRSAYTGSDCNPVGWYLP